MGFSKVARSKAFSVALLLLLVTLEIQSASVKDIFNLNAAEVTRLPRETQYYGNRYGSSVSSSSSSSPGQTVSSRPIKPEDAPEARERDGANVEKRCIRCDYYNTRDYRNPYETRGRYDERYDDRGGGAGGGYRDRYDDRYKDRYYEDDRRYYDTDRRYYDTDRKYYENDRRYDDRDRYDRYDRERYDRPNVRPEYYDRYDNRERYDRDDRNRYYDRYDRNGYRPWDETTRGSSGFDSNGRGYYFAVGRPEYSNYGSGYASTWNYGGGRDYNNRDRGWREQGTTASSKPISFASSSYRPRDPYDPGYNRGTSYLYGRPSSTTTTQSPSPSGGSTVTVNPQTQANTSSG